MPIPLHAYHTDPLSFACEALLLPVTQNAPFDPPVQTLDERLHGGLRALFAFEGGLGYAPTLGAVMVMPTFGQTAAVHAVLVGLGPASAQTLDGVRRAIAAAIRKAYDWSADDMAMSLPAPSALTDGLPLADLTQAVQGAARDAHDHLQRMDLLVPDANALQVVRGVLG
jgi:hypothetical protein